MLKVSSQVKLEIKIVLIVSLFQNFKIINKRKHVSLLIKI